MVVGVVVGVAGGYALLWFMRRVPLPGEGLYPLRTLLGAFALYGLAAVGHGSGFLAVFVAGILVGEARAPYKREIESFHSGLASLAEIVAFVVLGLTVDLSTVSRSDVWVPGIALAVVLSFVVRPLVLGPLLVPSRLSRRERGFVLFAGLKGAVPVLLGSYLLAADVTDADRLYGVVVVVVMFSVVVQGSLLPWVARILRVPVRVVEPEPWTVAVRLRDEPHGVHRFRVMRGSRADGATIAGLDEMPEEAWVSFVVRAGQLVAAEGGTTLTPGDEVLVLGDPADRAVLKSIFERRPDAH
jgi:cell volume regulation protein A